MAPSYEQDRPRVAALAQQAREVTGEPVALAFVDQAYAGQQAAQDAAANPWSQKLVKLSVALCC